MLSFIACAALVLIGLFKSYSIDEGFTRVAAEHAMLGCQVVAGYAIVGFE
jgi:hypothetical protein